MIPAKNVTPPPPWWCRSLVAACSPSTNQTGLHPSGPSSVAQHVFLSPLQSFLLVGIGGWPKHSFMHISQPLEDPAWRGSWESRGTSGFKYYQWLFHSWSLNTMNLVALRRLSLMRLYLRKPVCALNHTRFFSQYDDLSFFFLNIQYNFSIFSCRQIFLLLHISN